MENKLVVPDLVETDGLELNLITPPRKGKTFELDYMQIIYGPKVEVNMYEQKEEN